MTYYTKADDAADAFFRAQAKAEGLSYHDWCKKNGILDDAGLKRIEENEVSREAMTEDGVMAKFVAPDERLRGYKRRRRVLKGKEDCADLQHDAGGIVGPPNAARRRPSRSDAAEAAD